MYGYTMKKHSGNECGQASEEDTAGVYGYSSEVCANNHMRSVGSYGLGFGVYPKPQTLYQMRSCLHGILDVHAVRPQLLQQPRRDARPSGSAHSFHDCLCVMYQCTRTRTHSPHPLP